MTPSRQAFGLLLATIYSADAPGMASRPVGSDTQGLLFAVDQLSRRHLLVPVTEEFAFTEEVGESLSLKEWRHPSTDSRYLDLVCTSDQFAEVFSSLVDDIVRRMTPRTETPAAVVQSVLSEWRHLLHRAKPMSGDAARGLVGELEVLGQLARRNPIYALDCWSGPSGAVHDFTTKHGDLEVKASVREGMDVVISRLDQLDCTTDHDLFLIRLQVEESVKGLTISEKVDQLVHDGLSRSSLVEQLARYGFLLGEDPDTTRYSVLSAMAWQVTPKFPGLRSWDLPKERRGAITQVKYTLDLVSAPDPLGTEFETVLDRLMAN